jgi:hypothetical protein
VKLEQIGSQGVIAGGEGMPHGFAGLAVLFQPDGCPPVQDGRKLRTGLQQPGAQQAGKQVMVAVPAPVIIERESEQVRALESFKDRLRACFAAGYQIAQRAAQQVEYGGLEEKIFDLLGLAVDRFFQQVIQDLAMAARKAAYKAGCIGAALQRERGKLQP